MIVDVELASGLRADGVLARASFVRLVADPLAFTAAFYQRLFALAPALRPLFARELVSQHEKFAHTLSTVLGCMQAPDALSVALRQLGARHRSYGAQPQHFAFVGEALVQTLDAAEDGLEAHERAAWQRLFAWIMASMLRGWSEARTAPGPGAGTSAFP